MANQKFSVQVELFTLLSANMSDHCDTDFRISSIFYLLMSLSFVYLIYASSSEVSRSCQYSAASKQHFSMKYAHKHLFAFKIIHGMCPARVGNCLALAGNTDCKRNWIKQSFR